MLDQKEGVVTSILKRLGVEVSAVLSDVKDALGRCPRVSGDVGQVYLGNEGNKIIRSAQSWMEKFNDEYISVEHLFLGILDFKNGKFEYCNGGHNPPIIISPNGKTEFLEVKRNLPCGVMEGYEFKSQSIDICKGAKMVVYTDGVTEAEKADHSQFGENRLMEFALNHKKDDAKRLVASLFNEVDKFVAGAEQSDDITVMAIAE